MALEIDNAASPDGVVELDLDADGSEVNLQVDGKDLVRFSGVDVDKGTATITVFASTDPDDQRVLFSGTVDLQGHIEY
jgi:hypothetical protein